MQSEINSVIRVFPDYEEKIDFLFQRSESFRELCSDYILSVRALQELKKDLDRNFDVIKEYEDLIESLKDEILQFISKE